jgi:GTPase SAR1 family protein
MTELKEELLVKALVTQDTLENVQEQVEKIGVLLTKEQREREKELNLKAEGLYPPKNALIIKLDKVVIKSFLTVKQYLEVKKILIVGPEGSGKTSLIWELTRDEYKDDVNPDAGTEAGTKGFIIVPSVWKGVCLIDTVGIGSQTGIGTGDILQEIGNFMKRPVTEINLASVNKVILVVNPTRITNNPSMKGATNLMWRKLKLDEVKQNLQVCVNVFNKTMTTDLDRRASELWNEFSKACEIPNLVSGVIQNIQPKGNPRLEAEVLTCGEKFDLSFKGAWCSML